MISAAKRESKTSAEAPFQPAWRDATREATAAAAEGTRDGIETVGRRDMGVDSVGSLEFGVVVGGR